jgi:hypothetical protein
VSFEDAPPERTPLVWGETQAVEPASFAPAIATYDSTPDVPRLLPLEQPAGLRSVPGLGAAIPSRSSPAQPPVEDTTEVHVSIGRIEVTAVHESPPQRREPARPRKPKSLEAYLAERGSRA